MRKRVRLYPNEALELGLELKENERGRSNARYYLSETDQRKLHKIRQGGNIKRLFFDIETSPMIVYSWRVGYKIRLTYENIIENFKIICISYKWGGSDKVHTLSWDKNQCDKQLLIDFMKIANQADELVAHNGDRFDIKKIRTRCIFHRIPMFPKYRTLDTLKKARSGFAFPSNRLNDIGIYFGVGKKVDTGGFDLWKDVCNGDKKALKKMVEYCEGDIVLLEDVYNVLSTYVTNNTHAGVLLGGYKHECPNCGNDHSVHLKDNITAKGTIKRLMECDSCEYVYEISNTDYKKKIILNAQCPDKEKERT